MNIQPKQNKVSAQVMLKVLTILLLVKITYDYTKQITNTKTIDNVQDQKTINDTTST